MAGASEDVRVSADLCGAGDRSPVRTSGGRGLL